MKKLTRERVVPIISASVSCDSFGKVLDRHVFLAVARQQQQRARQPLLARIEQLIDEVFLDADVARQHVRDEAIRKIGLVVEKTNHLALRNAQHAHRRHGARRADAGRLVRKHALAKKLTGSEQRDDGLFSRGGENGKLHGAGLQVEDVARRIALRKDDSAASEARDTRRNPGRIKVGPNIERRRRDRTFPDH